MIGKPATDPLLVRVQDLAQHQFASGIDELDVHNEESFAGENAWLKVETLLRLTVCTWERSIRPAKCRFLWPVLRSSIRSMNVNLGIWDKLTKLIIFLALLALLIMIGFWYLPLIQRNERMRKENVALDNEIKKEEENQKRLKSSIDAMRDPR